MDEIIEKIYTGKLIPIEEFEAILPKHINLKETFGTAFNECRNSLLMSQRKAFETIIKSHAICLYRKLRT